MYKYIYDFVAVYIIYTLEKVLFCRSLPSPNEIRFGENRMFTGLLQLIGNFLGHLKKLLKKSKIETCSQTKKTHHYKINTLFVSFRIWEKNNKNILYNIFP